MLVVRGGFNHHTRSFDEPRGLFGTRYGDVHLPRYASHGKRAIGSNDGSSLKAVVYTVHQYSRFGHRTVINIHDTSP